MKKTQNKGFTLVELIIVITILAILATIAFVSFSGYAGQSRDAKKQSELSNLKNKVEVAIAANSQDALSFVGTDFTTAVKKASVSFAWESLSAATSYNAWEFNYAAIWADSSKYTFDYAIWAVKNTGGSFYQLSAKLEDGTVHTTGNYSPRDSVDITYSSVNWGKYTFTGSNIGKFRVWDVLLWTTAKVDKVSSDLSVIETSWTVTLNGTTIKLASSEEKDLINTTNLAK